MRVLVVLGTRPEAIKLAPVVLAARARSDIAVTVCNTGQHADLCHAALAVFGITPDHSLAIMRPRQSLADITTAVLGALQGLLAEAAFDWLVVQGDTTTAFAAALAGFYARIPVAHVEAGLRTGDIDAPWPEEMNRRLVTTIARLHFAPLAANAANLRREGVEEARIHITGNTGIDAVKHVIARLGTDAAFAARAARELDAACPAKGPVVLITGHRRESFGAGFHAICAAIATLARRFPDRQFVYPVHPNPAVRDTVRHELGAATLPNVHLIEPLDYLPFVLLMARAELILTDSGGIQEEAPSIARRVIVMRRVTERTGGFGDRARAPGRNRHGAHRRRCERGARGKLAGAGARERRLWRRPRGRTDRRSPPRGRGRARRARVIRQRFLTIAASAMSVATASLALAFVRQLLIAAYFGASRALEIYLFAYAVANWVGFALGIALDSIVVMHLVRRREAAGAEASRALARAAFWTSVAIGLAASVLAAAATYVLAPVIATGFTAAERAMLSRLAWSFLPWICFLLPYYAAAARHKSEWRFKRVFVAELLVGAVSIAWLVVSHGSVRQLPAAYAAGYAVALVSLLPGSQLLGRARGKPPLRPLLRDVGELYLANQTGNVPSIADRHFQSLINPGGIAAIGYASQLLMGVASLIGMREIFIVPLAETERRNERIERLVVGMLLLSVPLAGAIACFAPEIVRVLFERGRFDAAAAELTAGVLRILAVTLVVGAVTTPLLRMLQIVRRIHLMYVYYLGFALFTLAAGFILISGLHLGAQGIAWMNLGAGVPSVAVLAALAARCGIVLRWWRIGGYMLFAAAVTAAAAAASLAAAASFTEAVPRLLVGGAAYAAMAAVLYLLAWRRLPYGAPATAPPVPR